MRTRFALPIVVSFIIAVPAVSFAQTDSMGMKGQADQGSQQLHQKMRSGMESMQAMKPTGNVDKDFAMMMKMHHQQALYMAEIELRNGKSQEMRDMAQMIITAQKKEIAQFDKWLAANK